MNQKDIKLFDKAIHDVKKTITKIIEERDRYHRRLNRLMKNITTLRNTHNNKVNEMINEQKETLDELYELFDDLTNEQGE